MSASGSPEESGCPAGAAAALARDLGRAVAFEMFAVTDRDEALGRAVCFPLDPPEGGSWVAARLDPLAEPAVARALATRRPAVAPNPPAARERTGEGTEGAPGRSWLVLPVLTAGVAEEAILLGRSGGPAFADADRNAAAAVLASAADRAAIVVLSCKLSRIEERTKRARSQLREFSRVGNLIVQERNLDRICGLFMHALKEHSVFGRGILTMLDEELNGYKWFFFGMSDEEIEYFHSHASSRVTREDRARIFQDRYRLGNSFYIPAAAGWEYPGVRARPPATESPEWRPGEFLFIPLYGSNHRQVGVVSVDEPADGRIPAAEALSSIELFANQVAHAMEERKLDREVKKSTGTYKTLIDTMGDGLMVMDLTERILLVNPTLCKLVDYRAEEMIGAAFSLFLSEKGRAQVQARRDERRLGIKSRYEIELQGKAGEIVPVLLSGAPLYDHNRLTGSFAVLTDLREQKRAEEGFRRMHAEILEANTRLQESMDRLRKTQEQLIQSEKLSAIGQLVSGVAHELNNPLTGILGYAQLLMKRQLPPGFEKPIRTIDSEAIRCQKIVKSLLTFARNHKPEKRYLDLNEVLRASVELVAYQLRVDGIGVEENLAPDVPLTMADGHQIQQVIVNLITNAHQAMAGRPGGGKLRLRSFTEDGCIVLEIADTGPGIPDDQMGRIFDPFFTTKEVGKGTGLGLSLAYGIMQEHGGSITVRNAPAGGAIFRLELPVRAPEVTATRPAETRRRSPTPTGRRILVVDDESTVLDVLSDLLGSRGHEVIAEQDPVRAIERIKDAPSSFDLVITDLRMPGLDGRAFYKRLLEAAPALAGKVIFASGDTLSDDVRSFIAESGERALPKPFRVEELDDILRETSPGAAA